MKWSGDPRTDLLLSLMDDTGTAILGQVIKDGEQAGWNGFDYVADQGNGVRVGYFDTAAMAKKAVELSVEAAFAHKETKP